MARNQQHRRRSRRAGHLPIWEQPKTAECQELLTAEGRRQQRWTLRPRCHGFYEMKKRWVWHREVSQWKAAITAHLREHPILRPLRKPLRLYAQLFEPHELRDPPNVEGGAWKAMLDAFQECKVIGQDNWAWIKGGDGYDIALDKRDPRVILVLTEA